MSGAALRVKGHAWRGVASNAYGDVHYVCECGDTGFPVALVENARDDHRTHKVELERRRVDDHIKALGYPPARYVEPRGWEPPEHDDLIESTPEFTVWEDENGREVVVRHG